MLILDDKQILHRYVPIGFIQCHKHFIKHALYSTEKKTKIDEIIYICPLSGPQAIIRYTFWHAYLFTLWGGNNGNNMI